jgi:CheY-like chemotaxis protein
MTMGTSVAKDHPREQNPIETVRLSDRDRRRLVDSINDRAGGAVSDERRRLRVAIDAAKAIVEVIHPSGARAVHAVVPRNLSRCGFAFILGRFVYSDSPCVVDLPTRDGQSLKIPGKVLRCRHVQGMMHEVSVLFSAPIDLTAFATLTADEQQRLEQELWEQQAAARKNAHAQEPCSPRALIIAGGQTDRSLFALWMKKLNLDCLEAAGAGEALAALQSGPVNLIVVDLDSQPPDGKLALISELRHSGFAGPIVALTADEEPAHQVRVLEAGCQAVVYKPLDQASFKAALEPLVGPAEQGPLRSTLGDCIETQPLLQQFVGSLASCMEQLRSAVMRGDVGQLLQIARTLKGAGGTYGFSSISAAAKLAVEQLSSTQRDAQKIRQRVDELIGILKRVRAE